MRWSEVICGSILLVCLGALGAYTGVRQWLVLRKLRAKPDLPDQEQSFIRFHARMRLVTSGLLLVLAGLLGCAQGFLGPPFQRVLEAGAAYQQAGSQEHALTEPDKQVVRAYAWFYVAILLVLLVVVILVGFDLWSIRRYALREQRKLLEDRRAMIARQAHRMRQERNWLN